MKFPWLVPALFPLIVVGTPPFSVHNDLLAFPQVLSLKVVFDVPQLTSEPQYEIVYSESYISPSQAQTLLDGQKEESLVDSPDGHHDKYELMNFRGQKYLCAIPHVAVGEDNSTVVSPEEKEKEIVRASDHGWELLKGMQESCIYYMAGWWMYSFCYNDGIKQFHPLPPGRPGAPIFPPMEDKKYGSYTLGKFGVAPEIDRSAAPESPPTSDSPTTDLSSHIRTRGETSYLVHNLGGGTTCDLTGHPRRIEVQFHCNPTAQDRITLIKETASCVYLMVIHTRRLCADVAFLPPRVDAPHPIPCREVIPDTRLAAWKAQKSAQAAADLLLSPSSGNAPPRAADDANDESPSTGHPPEKPLIIGGIEVGGQKLVGGSPERSIKPSKLIAPASQAPSGQHEEYVTTLAKSDGTYTSTLSEREMKSLGIRGSAAEVASWIERMHELAGEGKAWRLDVVKTADGLEFRGVKGGDDDEEEEEEDGEGESEDGAEVEGNGDEVGGEGEEEKRRKKKGEVAGGSKAQGKAKKVNVKAKAKARAKPEREGRPEETGSREEYRQP